MTEPIFNFSDARLTEQENASARLQGQMVLNGGGSLQEATSTAERFADNCANPPTAEYVKTSVEEEEESEVAERKFTDSFKNPAGLIEKIKTALLFAWSPFWIGIKIGAILVTLYAVNWLVTLDRLPKEYHSARAAKEKAIHIAEIQYRIDVAKIDLQKLTSKK